MCSETTATTDSAWGRLKRRRRAYLVWLGVATPVSGLVVNFLAPNGGPLFLLVSVSWAVSGLMLGNLVVFARCPNCQRDFFFRSWWEVPRLWTNRCRHCDTPIAK